jgi:hypothetical protein
MKFRVVHRTGDKDPETGMTDLQAAVEPPKDE